MSFWGRKFPVLIRSQRLRLNRRCRTIPLPAPKSNRIGLPHLHCNNPSDFKVLFPTSLSSQGKFIFPRLHLSKSFSTFSYDMVCILFFIFTHIYLTCYCVSQSASGQRVPDGFCPPWKRVELFLTLPLIQPKSAFSCLYSSFWSWTTQSTKPQDICTLTHTNHENNDRHSWTIHFVKDGKAWHAAGTGQLNNNKPSVHFFPCAFHFPLPRILRWAPLLSQPYRWKRPGLLR